MSRLINSSDIASARGVIASAPLLGTLGNSWIDYEIADSGKRFQARGVACQTVARLKGRLRFEPANNFGYPGDDSSDIINHLSDVIDTGVNYLMVEMLINDAKNGLSYSDSIGNIDTLIDMCGDNGVIPIIGTIPPRGDADNTSAIRNQNYRVNDYLWNKQASLPFGRIHVADVASALTSRSVSTSAPHTLFIPDNVHAGDFGAYAASQPYFEILDKLLPPGNRYQAWRQNLFNRTEYPTGWMTGNPSMYGTSGTAGAGASGDVPDGWTIANVTGSGTATAVCSKVTGVNGGEYLQIVLGKSGTGQASEQIELSRNIALQSGDKAFGVADIEASGLDAVRGLYVYASGSTTGDYMGLNNSGITNDKTPAALDRVAVTPRFTVAANETITFRVIIPVNCNTATPAGTITIKSAGVKGWE